MAVTMQYECQFFLTSNYQLLNVSQFLSYIQKRTRNTKEFVRRTTEERLLRGRTNLLCCFIYTLQDNVYPYKQLGNKQRGDKKGDR